ncbi:cytochrome c biogenesis protein ResB [Massilia sp. Leaf139]|uniref:cytochrome c biogenesis protein ResB n=1 Tax=Massilia sp. Leaf139 TaxID=1736272 RepID=UPI0006FC78F7|nr:cytochrome c biogenesis protein ResB [Massilia sp. Leaf139]KQQ91568.1 cytochrome C biogenesis protein ResB [Massilia sp. Leaf139]
MSTTGIELKTRRSWLDESVELVSSMRFAISLLMILSIAAIIGTVLRQNDAMPNYVNQFGPFWYEVFRKLGLYSVYTSWWFLLILLILIVSTSLCVIRNAPKMMRDMRSWRDMVREESLRNFHHKSEWVAPLDVAGLAQQSAVRLGHAGYKVKLVEKEGGTLVAAKKGAGNKFGYIFAHTAIIVILLGGMLDSELPIRLQQWFLGKTPYMGGGLIADVPAQHRLSVNNPTYRGNILLAEGQTGRVASIAQASGTLLQELPFDLQLKKFHIDFYSTGMPKLFASDVVVHDRAENRTFAATIKVNEPLIYKGVAVYQSSFEDGGSRLKLTGFPMAGGEMRAFPITGEVNGATELKAAGASYSVEWSGFRPFNVENIAGNDVRAVTKPQSLNEQLSATLGKASGSAGKNADNKDLKNVGPSVQYKLRDQTGQAKEFLNYMQPVTLEGSQVYLAGVRSSPSEAFRFLRIPADEAYSVREWMRLRAALANPALRAEAARRYAARTMSAGQQGGTQFADQLRESAQRTLGMFAGDGTPGGFVAVAQFLEKIPAAEQEKAAGVFIKMLNGVLWELWQAARAADGQPAIEGNDTHARFLQLATNALSDSFFYGAPVYLQLDEFVEVKASVLQVTRSPGKKIVYLGCVLLVAGIFAMFYIRERRLWIWVRPNEGGAHALMAMSTQRKTLDFEKEFEELAAKLPQSA